MKEKKVGAVFVKAEKHSELLRSAIERGLDHKLVQKFKMETLEKWYCAPIESERQKLCSCDIYCVELKYKKFNKFAYLLFGDPALEGCDIAYGFLQAMSLIAHHCMETLPESDIPLDPEFPFALPPQMHSIVLFESSEAFDSDLIQSMNARVSPDRDAFNPFFGGVHSVTLE